MKRLVSLNDISHDEWLMYRKKGITGTDAGAIVGLNPYTSAFDVYMDKVTKEVKEKEDNEAMRLGRDMEEYVARRFCEETGMKVRRANAIYQNDDYEFMLADYDRLIVGAQAGLECKTVSPYLQDKWKDGAIPLHYQMQVQHYLAVSGYDCWYVAALIYGREFIIRKIKRDEEVISNLITIESRFWKENVCKQNIPDPDGSDNYTDAIANLYRNAKTDKAIELFGYEEQLNRRQELMQLIDKLEKEKTEIDQEIKLQMKDAAYAQADRFRVSWTNTDSQRLDSKKLKEEAPEIYNKYSKVISSRRFTVKVA